MWTLIGFLIYFNAELQVQDYKSIEYGVYNTEKSCFEHGVEWSKKNSTKMVTSDFTCEQIFNVGGISL